jgi:hypothetical protein
MWNMICFVIAAMTGTTGVVSKGLKNLEIIPRKHSTESLQKLPYWNITHHKESATS